MVRELERRDVTEDFLQALLEPISPDTSTHSLTPHLFFPINMRSMSSTVNVARDWLAGMGQGAENQNFSIQYLLCPMTLNTRAVFLLRLAEVCRTIRVHSAHLTDTH